MDGDGVPVAQPLGPPLPPAIVRNDEVAGMLLQKLLDPKVELKPRKFEINTLAQESFQGISGTYDFAELNIELLDDFQ